MDHRSNESYNDMFCRAKAILHSKLKPPAMLREIPY